MRSLLRNRYLDGRKWILQCFSSNGNYLTVNGMLLSHNPTSPRFQYVRAMVMASPIEEKNKVRREKTVKVKKEKKATKKSTKRSSNETPDSYTNWRTGNIEVAQPVAESQSVSDDQSLSPWLQQLWRGGSSNSNSNSNITSGDAVTSNTAMASMIATSEQYALATPDYRERKNISKDNEIIDFDTFADDDELDIVNQKPKRTGGSGNNFGGMGYDGLGGGSAGDDDGHDGDDDTDDYNNDSSNNDAPFEGKVTGPVDIFSARDKNSSDPRESWPIDPNLYPHIRASLTDIDYEAEPELLSRDTGLSICTLGTSAGGSCRLRCNSATVIRSGSSCYLIDAGEGVHHQFILSRLKYNDIVKIFITHMHADHVLGLASILLCIQTARLDDASPRSIEIYGPVGLYNYVAMTLALTCTEVRKVKMCVYELHGGTQRSMRFSGNRKAYPEFQHKALTRQSIPQNADGTWTLVEPVEITTPELATSMVSQPSGFSVRAAEIHHIPELQCFGYTFQEPMTQPRPLNVEAARQLGVSTSDSYRMLKSGFSVLSDDKSRLIHADEVCGPAHRARKITIIGDCCLVPPAMEALAAKSDVLVHEATLSIHDKGKKMTTGGHSTSAQAAIVANKVKAQVLILNHLPKTLSTYAKCKEWLYEAESRIRGPTRVQLGYDHLEIMIPRNGFNFSDVEASKSIWPDQRIRVKDTIERIPEDRSNQHALWR